MIFDTFLGANNGGVKHEITLTNFSLEHTELVPVTFGIDFTSGLFPETIFAEPGATASAAIDGTIIDIAGGDVFIDSLVFETFGNTGESTGTFTTPSEVEGGTPGVIDLIGPPAPLVADIVGGLRGVLTGTLGDSDRLILPDSAIISIQSANFAAAVPEPGTLALFAFGLAGLGLVGWRRRRALAA